MGSRFCIEHIYEVHMFGFDRYRSKSIFCFVLQISSEGVRDMRTEQQ